jgi:hypothetical protein
MVKGKKNTMSAANMPKVAPPPIWRSIIDTKNGVVYERRLRLRLNIKLASTPCRGYDSRRYVWLQCVSNITQDGDARRLT